MLTVAIFFIVIQDPPHTICRTQIETFKESQKGILYKDPEIKTRKKPLLELMIETCKKQNMPGSCYGLFTRTRIFIKDFKKVSEECHSSLASMGEIKRNLFAVYDLMIRQAWGAKPPVEYQDQLNWYTDLEMFLFCQIKKNIIDFYGATTLASFEREKTFKKLPGAENMSENQIRELSILSKNCARYLKL